VALLATGEGWRTENHWVWTLRRKETLCGQSPVHVEARTTSTPGEGSYRPVAQPNGRLDEPHSDVEVDKTARTFEAAAALSLGVGSIARTGRHLQWSGSWATTGRPGQEGKYFTTEGAAML